jgi:hypothetical protein
MLIDAVLAPHSSEGRLLDLVISGDVTLLHDDTALHQWRSALSRLDLEFPRRAVEQLLRFLAEAGEAVPPGPATLCRPGPGALAIDGCADALVMSSHLHRASHEPPTARSCRAAELLTTLAAPSGFACSSPIKRRR